ncbi:unnamed protein product [Gongylonema pulchrum]|uniref:Skp1_POZ domain-containing protein n=1 Tax=Gongylonema pulchrum TaxID=637853 RepID=A0A183E7T0_9BILA|nr:unnamed protein product [Gongylonema pulchrum]
MQSCMDRLDQISIALETAGIPLKAALNLLHLITSLDGNPLPLDGTILSNTEQVIEFTPSDVRNLLKSYCKGTSGHMEYIHEDSENGEQEQDEEKTVDPLRVLWVISTFQPIDVNAEFTPSDVRNLLKGHCKGTGGRMEYIHEDSEDGEQEQDEEKTVDPLVSGSLPFNASGQ